MRTRESRTDTKAPLSFEDTNGSRDPTRAAVRTAKNGGIIAVALAALVAGGIWGLLGLREQPSSWVSLRGPDRLPTGAQMILKLTLKKSAAVKVVHLHLHSTDARRRAQGYVATGEIICGKKAAMLPPEQRSCLYQSHRRILQKEPGRSVSRY